MPSFFSRDGSIHKLSIHIYPRQKRAAVAMKPTHLTIPLIRLPYLPYVCACVGQPLVVVIYIHRDAAALDDFHQAVRGAPEAPGGQVELRVLPEDVHTHTHTHT